MMIPRRSLLSFLLCIALVISVLPLIGAASPAAAGSTVTISGKVIDDKGNALPDIWVFFWRQDGGNSFYVKTGSDGKYSATVDKSSESNKRFNLAANKDNGDSNHPRNGDYTTGEYNNVAPSSDRTGINIYVVNTKVILGGTVKDMKGNPIPGIWVFYWRQDGGKSFYKQTDGEGKFSARVDKTTDSTKRYNIVANKDNGDSSHPKNLDFTTVEKPNIGSGSDYATMEFRLDSGWVTLGGVVKDLKGNPIPGIWVFFWRQDGKNAFYAKTGGDGRFSARVEKSGEKTMRYNIAANKDNGDASHPKNFEYSTVEKPDVYSSTDYTTMELRLDAGKVTLGGTVTDRSNKPVAGIWVFFWRQDGKNAFYVQSGSDGKFSTRVEKSSATTMRYNIIANKDNGDASHPKNPEYTSVEKPNVYSSSDSTSLTFALDSTKVTLGGIVKDSKGNALPNIWIYYWRVDGKNAFYVQTGNDGKFSARVEKSSDSTMRYNIAANKQNNDPAHPKNPEYGMIEKANVGVSSDYANMEFRLDAGMVTLGGIVKGPTGNPLPDIWVYYWRVDGKNAFSAKTGSDGKFSARVEKSSDSTMRYNIVANKENNDPAHPKNVEYSTVEKTNVAVSSDWTNMEFRLDSGMVTLGGMVKDKANQPLANIWVSFKRQDGQAPFYVKTGSDGKYSARVEKSSEPAKRYDIAANKDTGDASHPKHTGYTTAETTNVGTSYDRTNVDFQLSVVTTPVPTITTPPVTPSPGDIRLTVDAVEMVSNNELGVAVTVTFPSSISQSTKREITIATTINGKAVSKTFDVTAFTTPGQAWGGYTRTENGVTHVKPYTPLRINLQDAQVPRFTDDTDVTVSVSARFQGGVPSRTMQRTGTVLLPVIFYHGYMGPTIRDISDIDGGILVDLAAYRPMTDFLVQNGYTKEDQWTGDDYNELTRRGYSVRRYQTLLSPDMDVTYTTAEIATKEILRDDVQRTVNHAMAESYASKVALLGHSTGGLVSVYYASVEPTRVAKVITVGTPHQGVSEIYNKAFAQEITSRQQAEALLTIQEGTSRGQENTIRWFIPKYSDALQLPADYVAGRDPNPYFTSTFTFGPHRDVQYHYVYSRSHDDTLQTLVLEKNADGRWYHVKEVKKGYGDHTVLAKSASNEGVSGSNLHRYPVNIWYQHCVMFRESNVHTAVLTALRHRDSLRIVNPDTDLVSVDAGPGTIRTGDLITFTPTPTPSLSVAATG